MCVLIPLRSHLPIKATLSPPIRSDERESLMSKPNQKSHKIVDAVRHIGPTLESEKEQPYVPAREDRVSKEEQAADSDLHVHTIEGEGDEHHAAEGEKPGAATEPLHTRLAGDTSSDPHTDIGPETPRPVNERPKNAA